MTTIGTFFEDGNGGFTGLISTATLQVRVTITRDHKHGSNRFILKAGDHTIGHATAENGDDDNFTLNVQLHQSIAPGLGRAKLKPRNGCYVITT